MSYKQKQKKDTMINDPILIKYLSGELGNEQKADTQKWLDESPSNVEYLKYLDSIYNGEYVNPDVTEIKQEWAKLEASIKTSELKTNNTNPKLRSWIIRVAAVAILAIGTTLIINLQNSDYTVRGTSDEPVAAILPDGSEVYLSKGSRLSYSEDFNQELRQVNITGDAFFKVTSDPERPFIVRTGDAKIRVTGTSFHVSAPVREDDIEVVVRSGKVLFYNSETYSENSFRVGLGPGEKGVYSQKLKQLNKTHDNQYKELYNK